MKKKLGPRGRHRIWWNKGGQRLGCAVIKDDGLRFNITRSAYEYGYLAGMRAATREDRPPRETHLTDCDMHEDESL